MGAYPDARIPWIHSVLCWLHCCFVVANWGKLLRRVHRKPHNIWPSAGLGKVANRNSPNMPRRDPSPSIELPINIYKKKKHEESRPNTRGTGRIF